MFCHLLSCLTDFVCLLMLFCIDILESGRGWANVSIGGRARGWHRERSSGRKRRWPRKQRAKQNKKFRTLRKPHNGETNKWWFMQERGNKPLFRVEYGYLRRVTHCKFACLSLCLFVRLSTYLSLASARICLTSHARENKDVTLE